MITLDDLDAALNPPRATLPLGIDPAAIKLLACAASAAGFAEHIGIDEMLEIAAEEDERGPTDTIKCLLEALRVRRADDDTACAILAALEYYHLPTLVDSMQS